jgi:phosphoadenosine phosphosulfate reductase
MIRRQSDSAQALAARLARRFAGRDGSALLRPLIEEVFPRRIALVSSFGAESAVLLKLVAEIDPALPVIFVDSGKHFPKTLAYRERLVRDLGLERARVVAAGDEEIGGEDSDGRLWADDPDRCCRLRKVVPLERALAGFDAWITGRKRYHGGGRVRLEPIEAAGGRIKINPLAGWSLARLEAMRLRYRLPDHPLASQGYRSIGCAVCTRPAAVGGGQRDGRWAGSAKTECGIH